MKEFAKPEAVLDGADMNQDIHQLIGYCVSLGWTEKEMPASHCADLARHFLEKHRSPEPPLQPDSDSEFRNTGGWI